MADLAEDTTHRIVTDTEKSTWNAKEPAISAGTTSQYWRGDKSWQTLNKSAVGLGSVDNTADTDKPVSTAQQAAIDAAKVFDVILLTSASDLNLSPSVNTVYIIAEDGDPIDITLAGGVEGITVIFKIDLFSASIQISSGIVEAEPYTFTATNECLTLFYDETNTTYRIISTYQ